MKQAFLTVDLTFGDAGKGSTVDFLTRHNNAHTVIRFNGGAQAGHRVVEPKSAAWPDGREHVFSQFGSGTLAGAATHLSRFMLVEPLGMQVEAAHLQSLGITNPFGQTTIDENALVTTPFHAAVNRLKELARGNGRHGSCGLGIGETMADYLAHGDQVLFVRDLGKPDVLREKLHFLQQVGREKVLGLDFPPPNLPQRERDQTPLPMGGAGRGFPNEQIQAESELLTDPDEIHYLVEEYGRFAQIAQIVPSSYLSTLLNRPGSVVFEAAQGVLLDEWVGFHPHTTWSTTTLANAETLLREASYTGKTTRIGLTRAYATRHGAGPFVTENKALTQQLPDARNGNHPWQQSFRCGWLDLVKLRYALEAVGKLDYLAVSCLDRVVALPEIKFCRRYASKNGIIDRLTHSPIPRDLAYQATLTQRIADCHPVLETAVNPDALLQIIEDTLGIKVGLVSAGETAANKRLRDWEIKLIDSVTS